MMIVKDGDAAEMVVTLSVATVMEADSGFE